MEDLEDRLHMWSAHYHLPATLRKALGRCIHRNQPGTDYAGLFALAIESFPVGAEHMWRQLCKQQVYETSFKEAFPGATPQRP